MNRLLLLQCLQWESVSTNVDVACCTFSYIYEVMISLIGVDSHQIYTDCSTNINCNTSYLFVKTHQNLLANPHHLTHMFCHEDSSIQLFQNLSMYNLLSFSKRILNRNIINLVMHSNVFCTSFFKTVWGLVFGYNMFCFIPQASSPTVHVVVN